MGFVRGEGCGNNHRPTIEIIIAVSVLVRSHVVIFFSCCSPRAVKTS